MKIKTVLAHLALLTAPLPALAQEWRVTPKPLDVENVVTCTLELQHPNYLVGFNISAESSRFLLQTHHLAGVAPGRDGILFFPGDLSVNPRVTLLKDSVDSDLAIAELLSVADLDTMIDGFAVSGNFSIAVLGGSSTAFRLTDLPAAIDEIAAFRNCVEELAKLTAADANATLMPFWPKGQQHPDMAGLTAFYRTSPENGDAAVRFLAEHIAAIWAEGGVEQGWSDTRAVIEGSFSGAIALEGEEDQRAGRQMFYDALSQANTLLPEGGTIPGFLFNWVDPDSLVPPPDHLMQR